MCVQGRPVTSRMSPWTESSSAPKKRRAWTALFTVRRATASLRTRCTATSAPTTVCGSLRTLQTDPTAHVSPAHVCYLSYKGNIHVLNPFCLSSVNRIANNGVKPFEMLFKASRCDDVDLVKSFTGEFNTKLGGMVRTHIKSCLHKPIFMPILKYCIRKSGLKQQKFHKTSSFWGVFCLFWIRVNAFAE